MSSVTVILSGVPRNVTLLELSYYLECLFGTNTEIGTFDIRDLPQQSSKRQIALDFSSGFDAIAAQEKLDGYRYEMSNGQEYTLCAKITKKTELLRNESLSPVPSHDEPGVIGSSTMALIPSFSHRDVYRANAELDAQLELMKKQKMIIRAQRELVKERRRLKREQALDYDSDEYGGPSKARRRSKSTCSGETRSRSRSQERRRGHPVTSTAVRPHYRSMTPEFDIEELRLSSRNSRETSCSPDRSRADRPRSSDRCKDLRSKLRRRRIKDRRSRSKESSKHSRSKSKETSRHSRSKSKETARHSRSKSKESSRHTRSKSKETARHSRSKSKEISRHSRSKSKETSRGRTSRSKETSRCHRSTSKKTRKQRRSRSKKTSRKRTSRSRKTSRHRRSRSSDRKSTSKETSRHRRSRSKGTSRHRRSRSQEASKDRRSRSKGSSRDRRSSSRESSRDRRSRSKETPRERRSRSKENYREQRSRSKEISSRDRRAKRRRSRSRWDSGYKDCGWRFRSRSRSRDRGYRDYRSRSREFDYRKPSCLTEYRPRYYGSSQSNATERGSRPLAIMLKSPEQYQTTIVRVIRDRVDCSEVDFHNEIDHFSVNDEQDENSSMSDSKTGTEPKLSSEIIDQLPEDNSRLTQKKLQCATITSNNANCSQNKSALNTNSSIIKANSKITPKNKTAHSSPTNDPNVDKILLPVPSCSNNTRIGSADQVSSKKKKKNPSSSARKAIKTLTRVEQVSKFVKVLMHTVRDEIAIKNRITLSESEKYKLDDKLKTVIDLRVKPLVESNESDTQVLLEYRRLYSKEEDTLLVKRFLDTIREPTDGRAKYSSEVHTRGKVSTLTFIDLSTDLDDSHVKGVEIVELNNDAKPKKTYLEKRPYRNRIEEEMNAKVVQSLDNHQKNVVNREIIVESTTSTQQQTTDLAVPQKRHNQRKSGHQSRNPKLLPARPKFVLVIKKLLKELKPVLYNCKEANVNWNLLCKIKQVLRIIIGDMLKGKDYMPKKDILKHFRSLYPRDKDVELINNIRKDLDNGKYDLDISDTEDPADKLYDDEVIFVANKYDVITVADSDDDKEDDKDLNNYSAGAEIPNDMPNEKENDNKITQQEESHTLQNEKESEEVCGQQAVTEANTQFEELEKDKGIKPVHENKEVLVQKSEPVEPENLIEHFKKEETETIDDFHNAEDDSRSNDVEKETPVVTAITIMTSTSELLSLKHINNEKDIKTEYHNEDEQETKRDEDEEEEETIEAIIKCVESFCKGSTSK